MNSFFKKIFLLSFAKKRFNSSLENPITNIRQKHKAEWVPGNSPDRPGFCEVHSGDSICVTCKKEMPGCWDTVCADCGDTSCYQHSHLIDNHWICEKCFPKLTHNYDTLRELRPQDFVTV